MATRRRFQKPRVSPANRDHLVSFVIIGIIFALWFMLGMPGFWPEPPVLGNATVRDADTLDIGTETFRLVDIDALEFHQTCMRSGETKAWPCGQEAAKALARHISGRTVSCLPQGKDRYGRTLAKCDIGGADIAAWLAGNGWGFDPARYGGGPYANLEQDAAKAKRGAWSGSFTKPWDWRPDHPIPGRSAPAS